MFNISTEAEQYRQYGWEDLHQKSHGEALLWLALNRFRDHGLFILDEPESALSPERQLALLGRMRQLVTAGSQFMISTHSPILMAYPGATIFSLGRAGIEQVNYMEREHYAVTKTFLQDPNRMLREIFADVDKAGE